MRRLALAVLLAAGPAGAAGPADGLLQSAAAAYREGRMTDALTRASEALAVDPRNAVAKNYIWVIIRDLKKKKPRLLPKEKEEARLLAVRHLEERRRRTNKALAELERASRQSGNLRSPTGLLNALEDLGRSLGSDTAAGGVQGQVYMDSILGNIQAALDKNVFVSRKDHIRAEGYLAFYRKDWPRAAVLWEKALREDPDDAQVRNDLSSLREMLRRERERDELKDLVAQASTHQETGLYLQAVEAWTEVLRRDPRRPGAVEALAASRVALEKTDQLKKLDAMNEEAALLYRQGKPLRAAEIWLEALQLDPTYRKARVWLKLVGRTLDRSPETERSPASPVPSAGPAAVSAPDVSRAEQLYKKGLVAYASGRLEEAIALWRQSLAADPGLRKAQEALKQGESELSLSQR